MYWGLREKGQSGTLKPPRPVNHTTIYPASPAANPELPGDCYPQELLRIPSAQRQGLSRNLEVLGPALRDSNKHDKS